MTVIRGVKTFIDNFDRAQAITTTPGMNGWTIKDTSANGTPTYLCITEDGGALKILHDNTNEAQVVTLYHNDVLAYDLAQIQNVWWIAKTGDWDNVTDVVLGIGSAQNDTEDSVTVNAWFKIDGSASTSNVVVETDDNTNNVDDTATGTTLSTTYKKLMIDFTNGLPDVRFFVDGSRVASGTTFDMSDVTSGQNVQPYVQTNKASGTGTPSLTIAQFGIQYAWAYGA